MRDRSAPDKTGQAGVALAAAGHLLLLGLLSVAWGQQQPRAWPAPTPLEVSLVTEVTPEAQSPAATPAPSLAPETGEPQETAPASAPNRPVPSESASAAVPPQPVAQPAPALKPAAVKPVVAAKPQAVSAARPAPAKPSAARSNRLTGLALGTAGTNAAATAARPRGHRLGNDFLAGLSADAPERKPSAGAPVAKTGAYPTASIVQAIARQIQPCADRQVNPGPGANRITTTLNIRLNQDGTLAATPGKVGQSGVDDENDRYAQRVVDLGIAAFKGCSPLKLPGEYYRTSNGGWGNINYQWKLR